MKFIDGVDDMAAMSSKHRLRAAFAALVFATVALLSTQPVAQDLSPFEGQWKVATLEVEPDVDVAPAPFELEIRQLRGGGFAARWTNPPLADSDLGGQQIDARFAPSGDGVFAVQPPEPSLIERVFARPATGNPLAGDVLLWGRRVDDALVLYSLAIGGDGHPALVRSSYTPDGDQLAFERSVRIGVDEPLVMRGRLARRAG